MAKTWRLAMVLCLISFRGISQLSLEDIEFGFHAGPAIYQGDLTPSIFGSYRTMRLSGGFHYSINLSPAFSIRPNFDFGSLAGDDSKYNDKVWRQMRNFRFTTTFKEVSLLIVWDLLHKNYEGFRTGFSPYVFSGFGYSFLKTKADYSRLNPQLYVADQGIRAGLAEDIAHGYSNGTPVVPAGIGVRHSISSNLSLKAEVSYRFASTDYIDGFSKAAEPNQYDRYYTFAVGIIYSPGKNGANGIRCPG